ncbi:MAG: ASCH domain-containing protein [Clostridiaceae bacterium]
MDATPLPEELRGIPALSIHQPYAWLIAEGVKDIENRSWYTQYRGQFLIHAAKTTQAFDDIELLEEITATAAVRKTVIIPPREAFMLGGIVGIAEIADCVQAHPSVWLQPGCWGFVIRNARPLPFFPCRGRLGFFYVK